MTTLRIPISGRTKRLNSVMPEGCVVTLIMTTPSVDNEAIQLTVETVYQGVTTTENAGALFQSGPESMLKPAGGAGTQTIKTDSAALLATLLTDFATAYDAMEVAAGTAAGINAAAVDAVVAPVQVTIAALIDTAKTAVNTLFP